MKVSHKVALGERLALRGLEVATPDRGDRHRADQQSGLPFGTGRAPGVPIDHVAKGVDNICNRAL